MVDLIKLLLSAGDGGHGRVSFRREKFVPKGGPDGGVGGDGGNIILEADAHITTLSHFFGKKKFIAQSGEMGGKKQCSGAKGNDVILKVPIGTVVWLLAENETSAQRRQYVQREGQRSVDSLQERRKYRIEKEGWPVPPLDKEPLDLVGETDADTANMILNAESLKGLPVSSLPKVELVTMMEHGQQVVVCRGGRGGRGNMAFKGPANTTPLEAEYGTWGEEKIVLFELKLLADVGLVGFPNAGKSTLLSVLTKARPKVASYPFTTLEPQLGVIELGTMVKSAKGDITELVIADIPGLIEGASAGKGLGHDFLRHVEHCQVLLVLLAPPENIEVPPAELWHQYEALRTEMQQFNAELLEKPEVICFSKTDIYSAQYIESVCAYFAERNVTLHPFSSATRTGLQEVLQLLLAHFQ